MAKGKKDQKRKPQGAVAVATHKPLPPQETWCEVLDAAIERQFPNLRANTYLSTKGYVTTVTTRDADERLMPRQHRVVSAFVAGFMACERSY